MATYAELGHRASLLGSILVTIRDASGNMKSYFSFTVVSGRMQCLRHSVQQVLSKPADLSKSGTDSIYLSQPVTELHCSKQYSASPSKKVTRQLETNPVIEICILELDSLAEILVSKKEI